MRFQNDKPQCEWCRSLKLKQSRCFLPTKVLIHYYKWNSWSAGYWMVIYLHAQERVSYGSSQYECAMSLDVLCTLFSQSQKKEPLRTVTVLRKCEETVCSLPSTCTQHAVLRGERDLKLIVALARARNHYSLQRNPTYWGDIGQHFISFCTPSFCSFYSTNPHELSPT